MKALAQAIHAFQADAPPIHLDATNPHFGSRFASLSGVVAAIRPALNKHGLVYMQVPTNLDGNPALKTVVMHAESGEALEETTPLVLANVSPQGYGSALTYMRRYSLLAVLGLVGDADDDANSATPQPAAHTNGHAASDKQNVDAGGDPGDVVLTFGKHKDTPIRDVPRPYLEWWVGQEPPKTEQQKTQRAAAELYLMGATNGVAGEVPVGVGGGLDDDIPFGRTFA